MEKDFENVKEGYWDNLSFVQRSAIYGVVFGFVILIIAWIIQMLYLNASFSIEGILQIHRTAPLLLLVDVLPIIIYFIVKNYAESQSHKRHQLEDKLQSLETQIKRNVQYAKMIGEKVFSHEFEIDKSDLLAVALQKMRENLEETAKKESELNWIAQGKDKISNILRLHNNIDTLAYETIVNLINYTSTIQGGFYIFDEDNKKMINIATYAYNRKKYIHQEFKIGEGLIGQAAYEMDYIYRKEIPAEYVTITSGILGDKKPSSLLIVPLISDEKLQGVIELASLDDDIPELSIKFVKEMAVIIAQTVFNLKVNSRTEKLLKEARIMTEELRENEEELRQNAEEMRATQEELQKTNRNLEKQILEVENAQKRLYSLLENASEVISIYDQNGMIKYESPSVKHILGYAPEEVIGKNAFEVLHTGESNLTKQVFLELLENPDVPQTFEYQFQRNEEDVLWLESTGRNFLNNPAIQGIIFNTRDITVRKVAERAQRMSGQMQALSENSLDLIMRVNLDGMFFYANPAVEQYTGISVKDVIKRSIEDVPFNDTIATILKESLESIILYKDKLEKEFEFESVLGKKVMQLNAIPEYNEDKILETILLVSHDITEQKKNEAIIREKNRQITDSINYAQRIQKAILPDSKIIQQYLPESFVLYKPRDVISGDFPWFFEKNNEIYIAAVDCTGHGVPGALLSFIGYFLLNNIVDHDRSFSAGDVLDLLHEQVRSTLKQDQEGANARDGMDIALCKVDFNKKELQFAGAHRPLFLMRGSEVMQYKGTPKAIGGIPHKKKEEAKFENHVISILPGDRIFFFSDGLPDQVGGPTGRKYQAVRIKEEIREHMDYNMSQYAKHFARDFNTWKGDLKQTDDVLLIGIEF